MSAKVRIPSDPPEQFRTSSDEGTLFGVRIKNNSFVKTDDVIFEVEFEKFIAEIVAPNNGRIKNLTYSEGDKVNHGEVICEIDVTAKRPWYLNLQKLTVPFLAFWTGVALTILIISV
ncbi:lipoyl domain-containing protein [Shewanella sp. 202IG2-18]|uniref:biotin/lipoyl-containing protein n=1 Tax=Parashewanella hymeniacidonis TaxID=2807618 RepID=UPI00195F65FF|nr:lipoyl domain-containing protein [Parashewanella hymeniacidonis]MBM7073572.1 lipoyl domain-containing protein [Parashewanella hymeniacidonis]